MEPDKTNDLSSEGVDIVGSSVALDNEFSKPEEAAQNTTTEIQETEIAPVVPITTPAPEPVVPKTPEPTVIPVVSVMPKAPEVPKQTEKKAEEPMLSKNDPSIKQIRTFKMDAEEAVKYGNMSKADIAIAEQKKRDKSRPIEYVNESRSRVGLFVTIFVVLAAIGGGGYYWYFMMPSAGTTTATSNSVKPATKIAYKPIVSYSQASIVSIDINNLEVDPMAVMASKLGSANPGPGNVFALIPAVNATATSPLSASDALRTTHIPDRLSRSLGDNYMIGLYAYTKSSPFVILKNTFFQNAFSGMLSWEKDLGGDFMSFIQISYPGETIGSLDSTFGDGVISNIDVRTLKDSTGQTVLAYAFADKDTIIITTTEESLKYLLDRILQVRTIQ